MWPFQDALLSMGTEEDAVRAFLFFSVGEVERLKIPGRLSPDELKEARNGMGEAGGWASLPPPRDWFAQQHRANHQKDPWLLRMRRCVGGRVTAARPLLIPPWALGNN